MPPIGDLDGLWRSLAGSVAIGAGAIAHDDLDGRMVLQPGGQGLGLAVGQQVDDPITLQVAQDRAVALAFAPGPVITPRTRVGGRAASSGASRMRRSRVVAPTGAAIVPAMRAPALPPSARATAWCRARRRSVWRALGRAIAAGRSANVRWRQAGLTHRKRRMRTSRISGRPRQGTSPRLRQ